MACEGLPFRLWGSLSAVFECKVLKRGRGLAHCEKYHLGVGMQVTG